MFVVHLDALADACGTIVCSERDLQIAINFWESFKTNATTNQNKMERSAVKCTRNLFKQQFLKKRREFNLFFSEAVGRSVDR